MLGEWGFRRLTLRVDARALVPRPETEVVVERCLALARGPRGAARARRRLGSGAIALAIADEQPGARVDGDRRLGGRARARARERAPHRPGGRVRGEHDFARRRAEAGRGTSSSRTRRTSIRTSCRRSSPRCATGSRAPRSSAGHDRGDRAWRGARAAARRLRSCWRSATAAPARSRRCSTALGLRRTFAITTDLAGAERVVEGRAAMIDEAVAAIRGGQAGHPPDRHRLRPLRHAVPRGGRPTALPAQGPAPTPADGARRRRPRHAASSCVPELRGRAATIAAGAPARAATRSCSRTRRAGYRWLTGARPDDDRRPRARAAVPGGELLERVGAVAATSANLPGGPDPRTARRRAGGDPSRGCAAVIDGGELPGHAVDGRST